MSRRPLLSTLFAVCAVATFFPFVSAGAAFVIGIALTLLFGNPYLALCRRLSGRLLALSIFGLGAGMNLETITKFGLGSVGYTVVEIALAMGLGLWLGKRLRTTRDASLLITSGVTICGGSAIAVVALTIRAAPEAMSLSIAIIFLLNAVGIFLLPWLAHLAHFSEVQFGLWSALSITDTTSVVAAALRYGSYAVEVATNAKLARAIWIVPIAVILGRRARARAPVSTGEEKRARRGRGFPWFIVGFVLLSATVTEFPALRPAGHLVFEGAKRFLVLTLFVMGSTLTRETLSRVGARPLLQGTLLWAIITLTTFGAIAAGWIG